MELARPHPAPAEESRGPLCPLLRVSWAPLLLMAGALLEGVAWAPVPVTALLGGVSWAPVPPFAILSAGVHALR